MSTTNRIETDAGKGGRAATRETGKDATRRLARHAATLGYEALPPDLVELTKLCILDTLGVTIGASGLAAEGKTVSAYVKDLGGKPESSILGFGGKAPASWAVFVNGSLGHMLDYDDINYTAHVSIATVPVAFALAEKIGGVSGRDLIAAVAVGADVMTRLELSPPTPDWRLTEGWFATQLLGYLSGAATAGRMLGLDAVRMENALGIAFNQMSGSYQMAVGASTHMRSMQAGFSGQGAVLAAELAQRGIIGSKDVLEGRYGLFKTYVRIDSPNWDVLVGDLGARFPLPTIHGFKVWPACGLTRSTNAAVLRLRRDHGLRPEDIASITIIGGTEGTQMLSEPIASKRRPHDSIDGKFSIPFTTAIMMAKGNVSLRDYTDDGLKDPAVLAMADKVSYRLDAAISQKSKFPKVEIRTRDDRVFEDQPNGVPGDSKNPVDAALLEAKFRDCAAFSAKPIPAGNVDRAIEMIRDLENVADATEIIRLLV